MYLGNDRVAGGFSDTNPVGTISDFAGAQAPYGWMICDGRAISRTDYSDLFAVIGTTYGEGDGNTTFNIPNLKGRVAVGIDTSQDEFVSIGKTGGSKFMQKHNHTKTTSNHTVMIPGYVWEGGDAFQIGAGGWRPETPGYAGEGDSGNLQPYIVLNKIIKVSNVLCVLNVVESRVENSLKGDSSIYAPSQRAIKEINEYSLEEKVIGIWMGKTLYRKCYKVNSFPNAGKTYFSAEVSNIEEVIHAGGFAKTSNETIFIQGAYDSSHHDAVVYEPSGNQIRLRASSDRTGYSGYVWIEYTKTTD